MEQQHLAAEEDAQWDGEEYEDDMDPESLFAEEEEDQWDGSECNEAQSEPEPLKDLGADELSSLTDWQIWISIVKSGQMIVWKQGLWEYCTFGRKPCLVEENEMGANVRPITVAEDERNGSSNSWNDD